MILLWLYFIKSMQVFFSYKLLVKITTLKCKKNLLTIITNILVPFLYNWKNVKNIHGGVLILGWSLQLH